MKRLSFILILCLLLSCRLVTEPQSLTIIQEIVELAWIAKNEDNHYTVWSLLDQTDHPGDKTRILKAYCTKIELYLLDNFFIYTEYGNEKITHRYPIQDVYLWSWKKL